jgi:hypothetical protein
MSSAPRVAARSLVVAGLLVALAGCGSTGSPAAAKGPTAQEWGEKFCPAFKDYALKAKEITQRPVGATAPEVKVNTSKALGELAPKIKAVVDVLQSPAPDVESGAAVVAAFKAPLETYYTMLIAAKATIDAADPSDNQRFGAALSTLGESLSAQEKKVKESFTAADQADKSKKLGEVIRKNSSCAAVSQG